jgi:RNA polymerase sigma factor (sigma-70 family)
MARQERGEFSLDQLGDGPNAAIIAENRNAVHRAWIEAYSLFLSRARLLCHGNRDKAEDLVSQATLRILEFAAAYPKPLREVGSLYFMVLRNLAIDGYRATRRASSLYDHSVDVHAEADAWRLPICGVDLHEGLVTRQTLAAVQSLLDNLSGETRALFVQRFVEDRSYREIALFFDISEALARKRVQKLRVLLANRILPAARGERVTDPPPARLSSRTGLNQRTAAHGRSSQQSDHRRGHADEREGPGRGACPGDGLILPDDGQRQRHVGAECCEQSA